MTKAERKEIREITKVIHDEMPSFEDCDCYDEDGERRMDQTCAFHSAVERLYRLVGVAL